MKIKRIIILISAIIVIVGIGYYANVYTYIYKNNRTYKQGRMCINYTYVDVPLKYSDYCFGEIDKMIEESMQEKNQTVETYSPADETIIKFKVQESSVPIKKADYLLIEGILKNKGM